MCIIYYITGNKYHLYALCFYILSQNSKKVILRSDLLDTAIESLRIGFELEMA